MSDNSKASAEVSNLLAELDAEFGKKPKGAKFPPAPHKALNTAFHMNNPRLMQGPRGQLERMKFENYYEWEMHRQHLLDGTLDQAQASGQPELQWLPEARVAYIINQTCACCKTTVQFVGNEYVRFRGRRRMYRDLEGNSHETWPTMIKRVAEVDGNLLAFGMPGGDPLPDFAEEMDETVSRCAGCIKLEVQALDLWIQATQPNPQSELDIDIPLTEEGL